MKLRLTMMGRSYDATAKLPSEIELATEARVDDALEAVAKMLADGQELPATCLVVHNGKHLGTVASHDNVRLADQDDLVLIAPVAGG
jgi:molybdopterin converting factor small subunit